ncbi:MAG: hypothetical protein BM556_02230 [Bacteriovorax sp. MedPE-SWde]|nr:MAG: hypothetical protein BM556_02230 [Bacteriovorax sp. MedPE-SWde]
MARTPRVEIHPASIKHIKRGHPWITLDRFSAEFPKSPKFLRSRLDEKNFAVLLNDPNHPNVKARVWDVSTKSLIEDNEFVYDLKGRLYKSFELRPKSQFDRDNVYICFGEADKLPGLFIQKLSDHILIQFYADFWNHFERDVIKITREKFPNETVWVQKRNLKQEKEFFCATNKKKTEENIVLTEYGVNYHVKFNKFYDIGIYTDMSAIRERIGKTLADKDVLNLFSYTGVYSLYALKKEAKSVVSVDLSKKYINWLEENLEINPELDASKHEAMVMPTKKALMKLIDQGRTFDVIICDPPSSSTDGKKRTKAIDAYKELIPLIEMCLNKKGKAYIFLNTHSITRNKFEDRVRKYIEGSRLKVSDPIKLSGDCPSLKGFPEGDYLKGLTLHKS